jgi:7-cyano-7-deazaguanine reductase
MPSEPTKALVAVPNPHPGRDYEVRCQTPEFTCLCPLTGQPDFATVTVTYVPDRSLVELKSLKLYLWSYRNEGGFHEDMTNRILDDLVAAVAVGGSTPWWRPPTPRERALRSPRGRQHGGAVSWSGDRHAPDTRPGRWRSPAIGAADVPHPDLRMPDERA